VTQTRRDEAAALGAERVGRIQEALREEGIPAWLLFDFHGPNSSLHRDPDALYRRGNGADRSTSFRSDDSG